MTTRRNARRTRRTGRRGLALIEAIIGGVLLGAGMTVVMTTSSRALRAQVQGERRLVAAWLADDLLNMVLAAGPREFESDFDTAGRFAAPYDAFEFVVDTEFVGVGVPYRVSATIAWGERRGEQLTVETLIAARLGPDGKEDSVEVVREPYEELDREGRWFELENGEQ